jgi:hypothetical protein
MVTIDMSRGVCCRCVTRKVASRHGLVMKSRLVMRDPNCVSTRLVQKRPSTDSPILVHQTRREDRTLGNDSFCFSPSHVLKNIDDHRKDDKRLNAFHSLCFARPLFLSAYHSRNATRPSLPCLSHKIFSFQQTTTTHLRSRPQCSHNYQHLFPAPLLSYPTPLPLTRPILAPLLVIPAISVFPSPPRPRISLRHPSPFLA